MHMPDDVELLIAGGGLNGLVLGIACAGAGLPCAVVDRQSPAVLTEASFDGRSSAIAYGSKQVLSGIGLWPAIATEAEPILEIRVADDNAPLFCITTIASSGAMPRSAGLSKIKYCGAL